MPGDDASIGSYASSSSEESHGEEKWEDPVKDPIGGMGQSVNSGNGGIEPDADSGKEGTRVNLTAPKQGGVMTVSDGYQVAWTGGKPSSNWNDGLKEEPSTILPTQYRTDRFV